MNNMPDEVAIECPGTTGGSGCDVPFRGGFNVKELFVEALVPIVQDVRGVEDLSLELGYRWSDYSTSGGFNTYKGLLNWAFSPSLRLRGGYNRAVRTPTLSDLHTPVQFFESGFADPCEGENPVATFEQCARAGVTADQYGNIPASTLAWPGGISNIRWGGNPLLDPESADTYTAGVVWTPAGVTGLSVTLDYFNIKITDAIGELWEWTIHDVCMATGDPEYCDRIHRDEHGSIWLSDEGYTDVSMQNVGTLVSEGIDLNANYLIGLGGAGFLVTDLMGSYLLTHDLSSPEFDFECAGYFGHDCGQPNSLWRHRLRATWESSFRLNLSLAWRYLGSADMDPDSPYPDLTNEEWLDYAELNLIDEVRAYNWFDLSASYTMRNGLRFTVGVNNILDEEPPLLPGYADSVGTWFNLYGTYDPLGRYVFGSVQFNF
jgi:outer membrane receptor protein involved in Fe transport